jgi:plasmid maintenance system antidote protein VapI
MKAFKNLDLKVALMERNISQRELAYSIGLPENKVSRIVLGYEAPSDEIKDRIIKFIALASE